jgi:exodeoxyribonuclease VII large subunit
MNTTILTVTEITKRIKGTLERGFQNVTVQGELSNCKLHSSGHFYFSLKDEGSQLQGVMWRSRVSGLFFTPEDGMKVVVRGNITVYEVRGQYQLDSLEIRPLGIGELQLAFERLKQKLAAKGYFDPRRKKPLPRFPHRIGLVTSPTGAVLHDLLTVLRRRMPTVEVVLMPVRVQGAGAAAEIAQAIDDVNAFGHVEVLIVARGGGSMEDLWAFNEEAVAEAIFRSKVPVVSAVGHEVDFTIADFVADLRAPTPSAAAEMVVPDRAELVEILRNFQYTAKQNVTERLSSEQAKIRSLISSYSFNRPLDLVRRYSQQLDESRRTLSRTVEQALALLQQRTTSLRLRLGSLDPDRVLQRGYALVLKENAAVGRASELKSRERVRLRFHDGECGATVD